MVLSVESSAVTASVSLTDGDNVIKSEFINSGLTHSETLLPMIKRVMSDCAFKALDGIAVTSGPGSFTGIRIGISTVKGLAFHYNIPCYSISTLEAIAYNFEGADDAVICAVMDARRMQFYNALFQVKAGKVLRLTPDRAISLENLKQELKSYKKVIIAGDGAKLCYDNLDLANCEIAAEGLIYQNALSVAKAAENKTSVSAKQLMPVYLRQSQAERELKLKKRGEVHC